MTRSRSALFISRAGLPTRSSAASKRLADAGVPGVVHGAVKVHLGVHQVQQHPVGIGQGGEVVVDAEAQVIVFPFDGEGGGLGLLPAGGDRQEVHYVGVQVEVLLHTGDVLGGSHCAGRRHGRCRWPAPGVGGQTGRGSRFHSWNRTSLRFLSPFDPAWKMLHCGSWGKHLLSMGKYMQNAPPEWKGILIAWNYRKFRTKVSTMKTSATHLVHLASLASAVLALFLDRKESVAPEIMPRPECLPD